MSGRESMEVTRDGDTVARLVAYFSPYLFWAMVSGLCAGIWFFAG